MNRRRLYTALVNGDAVPAADITALRLPAVPDAVADYVLHHLLPAKRLGE